MGELLDATGRTLLLTGATGGIGSSLLDAYLNAGGKVVATDLNVDAIAQTPRVAAMECDLTSPYATQRLTEFALEQTGRIDDVVHCVGMVGHGKLLDTDIEDWQRIIDANLTSAFLLAKACLPALAQSHGNIVFLSSTNGRNGGSALSGAAYACAKSAIIGLNRYLAKEWAEHAIRVNCIAPGPVATPMLDRLGNETRAALRDALLTDDIALPDEIASTICFLLSPHARSITGAVINQSGGLVLD